MGKYPTAKQPQQLAELEPRRTADATDLAFVQRIIFFGVFFSCVNNSFDVSINCVKFVEKTVFPRLRWYNQVFVVAVFFMELFCVVQYGADKMKHLNRTWALAVCFFVLFAILSWQTLLGVEKKASSLRIAVLLDEAVNIPLSLESLTATGIADRVAKSIATESAGAILLHLTESGTLVNRWGEPVDLSQFDVLWLHRADVMLPDDSPFASELFVATLKNFVERGQGLLLTGGGTLLLKQLELDAVTTAPVTFGDDRDQSGIKPLDKSHPIFTNVDWDRGVHWLSNAAYPAYAIFQVTAGKPFGENPQSTAVPHLEYSLGQGKVLVAAWRIGAIYDKAPEGHRRNFEQFITNSCAYLGGQLTEPARFKTPFEIDAESLALAIRHLCETYGDAYPNAQNYLNRLAQLRLESQTLNSVEVETKLEILKREALLANPLLDFSQLLVLRRGEGNLGLPLNYNANSMIPKNGYDNELVVLSDWKTAPKRQTLFEPENGRFVGDVDLHFNADKMLFSMVDENEHWRVFEMKIDATGLKKLPLIPDADVDNYDACYLPDGSIVFCSTATFAGVPCVNGSSPTCNLYRLDTDDTIRQLTYEQDQDWCPTVLNNGRLMYLRWEYTDIPHASSRILFHANPDGTNQVEYYGSGSYWPASMFFAKAIPNAPSKFVAIIGGHHELPRMGDLVLFDPSLGRRENTGAIQRIPGRGRAVEPQLLDLPIGRTWPKFLHPYPLDEHFYIVAAKPSPDKPWGIYLVDTFDNMVLICDEPGYAMFEPIPIRKTPVPPMIPDRTDPLRDDAEVFIANIYEGEGLRGVSPGTVKSLRLFSYQFSYRDMGAEPYSIGLDGPWDPRRIIGTVPVNDDGSAYFRIPAYLPISMQPLDAEGKAVQQMRSWVTAMPGEVVSCVGCHEPQNSIVPATDSYAARSKPAEIAPWYGPARGFSFVREVQPVLDRYCVECHRDNNAEHPGIASFEDTPPKPLLDTPNYINVKSRFSNSYYQLRRFVRSQTKEGTMQVPYPREYHADTSRVVQILQKGHYGVELAPESWDRLITWIDLNAPFHGNWRDIIADDNPELVRHNFARRHEMRRRYARTDSLLDDDPNVDYSPAILKGGTVSVKQPQTSRAASDSYIPVSHSTNAFAIFDDKRIGETMSLSLGEGVEMELTYIPAGRFPMGQADSFPDERPRIVTVEKPFFMGRTEITNEQFARFDPTHDSRIEFGDFMHFSPGEQGWSLSHPSQPVVRVSFDRAMAFCQWLSQKTSQNVALPSESQWEYAARAGMDTPFWYGTLDTDFSLYANLSDICNQQISNFGWLDRSNTIPGWRPADARVNDHSRVAAPVASYAVNPFGLFDMHGNVAEWVTDAPANIPTHRIVKGGSWYDPPHRARAAFKQHYLAEQQVFDVGFRVIVLPKQGD